MNIFITLLLPCGISKTVLRDSHRHGSEAPKARCTGAKCVRSAEGAMKRQGQKRRRDGRLDEIHISRTIITFIWDVPNRPRPENL